MSSHPRSLPAPHPQPRALASLLRALASDGLGESLLVLANGITLLRLLLSVSMVAVDAIFGRGALDVLLWMTCAIWVSDVLDGGVARAGMGNDVEQRRDGETLDPLVDDFAYTAGFVVLLSVGAVPAWLVAMVIMSRSLFAMIRMVTLAQGLPFARPLPVTKAMGVVLASGQIGLLWALAKPHSLLADHTVSLTIWTMMAAACAVAIIQFAAKHGEIVRSLLTHS
jgi:phosphatidylglycerophosphate synthase